MDIYEIRKANLIALIGSRRKGVCANKWDMSPAHLSQILSNKTEKNLGDDVARRIEEKEELPRGWLDQIKMAAENGDTEAREPQEAGAPSEADYALIPQYSAKGDCGDGYLNDHVEINGGLAFKRDWIKRMGSKPENLYVIYADGESMEPYIFAGDVMLIDASCKEPSDRQVYAIRRPDGGTSIKRFIQQLTGAWLVRSDNQDKTSYPDEPVSEKVLHELPIIGRVIWRGGGIN